MWKLDWPTLHLQYKTVLHFTLYCTLVTRRDIRLCKGTSGAKLRPVVLAPKTVNGFRQVRATPPFLINASSNAVAVAGHDPLSAQRPTDMCGVVKLNAWMPLYNKTLTCIGRPGSPAVRPRRPRILMRCCGDPRQGASVRIKRLGVLVLFALPASSLPLVIAPWLETVRRPQQPGARDKDVYTDEMRRRHRASTGAADGAAKGKQGLLLRSACPDVECRTGGPVQPLAPGECLASRPAVDTRHATCAHVDFDRYYARPSQLGRWPTRAVTYDTCV